MMEHPGFSSVTMSHHHGGQVPGGGGVQQIGGLAPQLHGGHGGLSGTGRGGADGGAVARATWADTAAIYL